MYTYSLLFRHVVYTIDNMSEKRMYYIQCLCLQILEYVTFVYDHYIHTMGTGD